MMFQESRNERSRLHVDVRNLLAAGSIIIAAALSFPSIAHGQVLGVATLEGTYTQLVDNSTWRPIFVGTRVTALQFRTTKNRERIVITYSGECLAAGFTVNVRANIDGVNATPGVPNGVSLCSTSVVGGSLYPATRTFSALVARRGLHNLTIEVKGNGAAIRIGDSALVVQR
jgi:hypothetical protein